MAEKPKKGKLLKGTFSSFEFAELQDTQNHQYHVGSGSKRKLYSIGRNLSQSSTDLVHKDSGFSGSNQSSSSRPQSLARCESLKVKGEKIMEKRPSTACAGSTSACEEVKVSQDNVFMDICDDDFSTISGLPSGLVDAEGSYLGDPLDLHFGLEDEISDNLPPLPSIHHSRYGNPRRKNPIFPNTRGPKLPGYCIHGHPPVIRDNSASSNMSNTITQHYYPESGWGYVILILAVISHALLLGFHLSSGIFLLKIYQRFGPRLEDIQDNFDSLQELSELRLDGAWLIGFSIGISYLLSPFWICICRRKSTRLSAVFGGLITALGCLFSSFSTQFHQLFLSYGIFMGIGIGLTRDASALMVGQYFKRKRDLVEIALVSAGGLGIIFMSSSLHFSISYFGWRLGLQLCTLALFVTFFLGSCYRSASLYHPQRRAILHLKSQKRKIKEREKRERHTSNFEFDSLRSKTLRIILLSTFCISFGLYNPLFHMASECWLEENIEEFSLILLYIYLGCAWICGACLCGALLLQKSQECRISKQYLCQVASILCAFTIFILPTLRDYTGRVIFVWVYGFALGGYSYSLKVYTYERVRARHFPWAWGYINGSQAIPIFLGILMTDYMNQYISLKCGYYISAISVLGGSLLFFLIDVRKRKLSRKKTIDSSLHS